MPDKDTPENDIQHKLPVKKKAGKKKVGKRAKPEGEKRPRAEAYSEVSDPVPSSEYTYVLYDDATGDFLISCTGRVRHVPIGVTVTRVTAQVYADMPGSEPTGPFAKEAALFGAGNVFFEFFGSQLSQNGHPNLIELGADPEVDEYQFLYVHCELSDPNKPTHIEMVPLKLLIGTTMTNAGDTEP